MSKALIWVRILTGIGFFRVRGSGPESGSRKKDKLTNKIQKNKERAWFEELEIIHGGLRKDTDIAAFYTNVKF
jgi:hypothetical protein